MLDSVRNFWSTESFIPHGHCYLWKPDLVGLHVVSDLLTALAYYSIPLTLFYFVRKRHDLPFNWIFWLFGAFITACGTTHLLEVWTLWHPVYWLSGTIKAITALISLYTALMLIRLVPQALMLSSPAQLEAINRELQRQIADRERAEKELELQSIIVKNMAEGICLVSAVSGAIVYANPKFERMFGYDAGELAGKLVSTINYEDEHISAEEVYHLIRDRITQFGEATYEVRNVKKDGTPFWCWATTSTFDHPDYGTVLVAVQQDITDRKLAEEQIKASLSEKEVLLQEVHHRVKNNLQIVDSLLQLQGRRTNDEQTAAILTDSRNRIASIALVHEKLYGSSDLANIDFAQYIPDLTAHLFDAYNVSSTNISLETVINNVSLDIETAIPCGLIINELVSNSLKYAFPVNQTGQILVKFYTNSTTNRLNLVVQDDGVGLPDSLNFEQTKSLGLTLVRGLVKQLDGTIEVDSSRGTRFNIYL